MCTIIHFNYVSFPKFKLIHSGKLTENQLVPKQILLLIRNKW